ncbi:CpsD/CapB family tyrosine-protein kinase [Sporolactobacillus spathodeae]|uniref:Capsular exopolysaccharide synthesis family protein n=1 Tax=Sporolactobacillus spathodeae TaxID=1465502 RepID=A0ABS2Q5J6_9BACL|nr:CpsD/CapB family tyrosine-protein kinase [Sporolactobacillus spathodeae]MBM7657048.1 capsular exopolysaccharide synthesis family protein [Sporolactobacillus spathodeae]
MRRLKNTSVQRWRHINYLQDNFSLSEEYRTLRTNISFAKAGGDLRSLLVTSSEAGEGKSTTASSLAIVMAQQGKKVLLIDADTRKPSQHEFFDTDNSRGLTNVLTGQSEFGNVVRPTRLAQMFLMTSGPVPPNPADLLSAPEMSRVIQQAKDHFNVVILDSPPVLAVSDARLLATLCEGILLVVKSGSAEIDKVKKAANVLTEGQGKFLGVVLNDMKLSKKEQYYDAYNS